MEDLQKAVELAPKLTDANNAISWFLATCNNASYRNGKEAKKYGETACKLSQWKEWSFIDTLAAAEAELGDFEKAVEMQKKALEIAPAKVHDDCRERLRMYENKKPFRSEFGKLAANKSPKKRDR